MKIKAGFIPIGRKPHVFAVLKGGEGNGKGREKGGYPHRLKQGQPPKGHPRGAYGHYRPRAGKRETMDRHEAKESIKSRAGEYLKPARNVGGKPSYICPLCGNGTGHDGDGIVLDPKREGYKLHCFKCGFDGDLIDLYQKEHCCDFKQALDELCGILGVYVDDYEPRRADIKPSRASSGTETHEERQEAATGDYSDYIADCCSHLGDKRAQDYLALRGISDETARRYATGYDPATGFLVMPASSRYYTARNTNPEARQRFNNPKGAKVEPYNLGALYREGEKPVFVVEAALDALSIAEAGGEAVALNSASNTRLLLEIIRERPTSKRLIIALDNDEAGERAARALGDGLDELRVRFCKFNPYGAAHDANDALRKDRGALAASVAQAERAAYRPDNMADYVLNTLHDEAAALQSQANRKTGFANLDEQAGAIYSGLYAIGGISSVGKTSFVSQLADQMAEQGQHVLFFSMEQSRLELASKSVSRRTAQMGRDTAKTALQIRLGDWTTGVVEAFNAYVMDAGERVSVVEGNFSCTVGYIRNYTEDYIEANGTRPVVVVDYLQVLQADVDPATGRRISDKRLAVDYNVTELKRMSRELDLPVFVVSSFNRGNYLAPVDFEAFKESGGIEYTSDVVWGLQLAALNDELFRSGDEGKDKVKKRERLAQAKEAIPRDVELVCLKNRYGKSRYRVRFTYWPQFDLFEPEQGGAGTTPKPTRRL